MPKPCASTSRSDGDRVTAPTVLVVGAGLLGASAGMALRNAGWQVHLRDRMPASVRLAEELGAGTGEPPAAEPDVVLLAVPPSVVVSAATSLREEFANATFTDVASAKSFLERQMQDIALADRFVGGHPMAGRERSGVKGARADLFAGRPWVICSTTHVDEDRVGKVRALATATGAHVVEMSAAEHDEAVAKVSHVPQLVASVLAAQLRDLDQAELELAGQGLRDTVRIAASDPELWTDIIAANEDAVRDSLQQVVTDLQTLLSDMDPTPVLAHGRAGHARIPGKHGSPAVAYAVVPVVIPDEPGALARLFASAGEAGINIEDVAIEHSPGQPVGLVELFVVPEKAEEMARALTIMGWSVH